LSKQTFLIFCLSLSCGYRTEYGAGGPERLHVKLVRTLVPDVIASDEVASGVREELARAGGVAAGEGYPRVEIEVLRADEASEGITAGVARVGRNGRAPVARATDISLVARAWIVRTPGARAESDTGDVRAEEVAAVDELVASPDPRASGFHYADALRAAARRLGRKLARRVVGVPAASEEVAEPR
jgi:hypothetical protein